MKKPFTIILFLGLIFFVFPAYSLEPPAGAGVFDDDGDGAVDHWEFINEAGGLTIYLDTRGDGKVDFVLEQDKDGYKIMEAMDFNGDGELDDYYYYSREVLVRREVDTNYDGQVDTWVFISEGVYIERYERDTDYDGQVDLVKSFGE